LGALYGPYNIEMLVSLFILMCADYSGQAHEACMKALEASAIQSGVQSKVDMVKGYAEARAQVMTDEYVRKDVQGAVGTAYVLAVKREIRFSTRVARPLIETITVRGAPDSVNVGLVWTF
jgi:hypothetical protein